MRSARIVLDDILRHSDSLTQCVDDLPALHAAVEALLTTLPLEDEDAS